MAWQGYAVRFSFGGLTTVLAGLIDHRWGPTVGGLFLAFPAIFPASATLTDTQQRERKERAKVNPGTRGREVVALEAAGAAMGTVGLLVFAFVAWQLLPRAGAPWVLAFATGAWVAASVAVWKVCDRASRRPGAAASQE